MRFRIWALIMLVILSAAVVGCSGLRLSRAPADTPFPTKTLRPTFTNTPVQPQQLMPTATPQLSIVQVATTEPTVSAPPTIAPPTAPPPPPTPEPPTLTVANATVNVRSGPGTNYARIGQVRQGQSFVITGKNPAGDWWQFDYNGRTGWIIGRLVNARSTEGVQVAANIPAPPPTPRPTARPTAVPPTQPPAPTYQFAVAGTEPRPSSNNLITVWCRVLNSARNGLLPGTIRVSLGGNALAEQSFTDIRNEGDPGLSSEFYYNQNCKVELPLVPGTYTAYLIAGGEQISDPVDFKVEGETRIFILTWVQK